MDIEMESRAGGVRRLNAWFNNIVPGALSRRREEPSGRSQQQHQQHTHRRTSIVAGQSSRGTAQRVANTEEDVVVSNRTVHASSHKRRQRKASTEPKEQRRRVNRVPSGMVSLQACEDLVLALLPDYRTTTPKRKTNSIPVEPEQEEEVFNEGIRESHDGVSGGGRGLSTGTSATAAPASVSMASNKTTKDVAPKTGTTRQRLRMMMRTGGGGAAARGVAMLRTSKDRRGSGRNGERTDVEQKVLATKEEWWLEEEVWKLLQEHEPSRVVEAKTLMDENRHRLAELLIDLRHKYGVHWSASNRAGKRKNAKNNNNRMNEGEHGAVAPRSCNVDDL